jgi:hypothetical protein
VTPEQQEALSRRLETVESLLRQVAKRENSVWNGTAMKVGYWIAVFLFAAIGSWTAMRIQLATLEQTVRTVAERLEANRSYTQRVEDRLNRHIERGQGR